MLPEYEDLILARTRIKNLINETPFISCPPLNELLGANVYVKAECLQPRGSFKIRGATNAILKRRVEAKEKGVIAYSSGNHAQGVALACKRIGAKATIIVPKDVPVMKLKNARDDGADIIFYDRLTQIREEIGDELQKKTGAILIPPYDHKDVIAGQGTIGLEIVDFQVKKGFTFDKVITQASGGGLAAGIGLALEELSPMTKLIIGEPYYHDDLKRSLEMDIWQTNAKDVELSIQDALMAPSPGKLTFPIISRIGALGYGVNDIDCLKAIRFAFEHLKLVLEPGGANALALALFGGLDLRGQNICIIASGGNIDAELFSKAIA